MDTEQIEEARDILRAELERFPASEDGLELLAVANYTLKLLLDKMED